MNVVSIEWASAFKTHGLVAGLCMVQLVQHTSYHMQEPGFKSLALSTRCLPLPLLISSLSLPYIYERRKEWSSGIVALSCRYQIPTIPLVAQEKKRKTKNKEKTKQNNKCYVNIS